MAVVVCPYCGEPGFHGGVEGCLAALRAAIALFGLETPTPARHPRRDDLPGRRIA